MLIKIIQLAFDDSELKADRFARVEGYFAQINGDENRPDIVVLPEIWGTGFFNFERYATESESLQGETFTRLAPWAEKIGCYLLAGSIIEKDGSDFYNTALLIGPDGSLVGKYRKIHLFGYHSQEGKIMTRGADIVTLKTDFGIWGISICYDLRFPELYRKMVEAGAEVIFVVSAWPLARLEHWLLLNRARALENLCYLVSCNCAGHLKEHTFCGNSMVVDPWGEIVALAGTDEELLAAKIDLGKVAAIRAVFPALHDRQIL
ncbi:MAG TPA: carbon-nitrogen family hydrolase [Candidatus Limnocylindrales bacterium]|nr:carbon-nitrogen family hydrolase [Candidatus Limnocylindrales bacterium]